MAGTSLCVALDRSKPASVVTEKFTMSLSVDTEIASRRGLLTVIQKGHHLDVESFSGLSAYRVRKRARTRRPARFTRRCRFK